MTSKKSRPTNAKRLVKTQVIAYLEPEQATELKGLSDRTRIPQQVYMREGVDMVLSKYRKAKS